MLARHMYIFEAKYIPIIATLKHKAVDMKRQCGSTFFFTTIRSFDKNFVYLCFSLVFFQKMFLRLFRFIENWSNSLFFNNSLYLLFLINYSKNRSHIFDFSFIHTQHKQHVRIPTIYGHKWVNKIAAVIRHRRRLPDL